MTKILKLGVCEGRHDMPSGVNFIFSELSSEEIKNPLLLQGKVVERLHEVIAQNGLSEVTTWLLPSEHLASSVPSDYLDVYGSYPSIHSSEGAVEIQLYATGLTVALLAILQAIKLVAYCNKLTVMHFDRDSGEYYEQELIYPQ